MDWRAIGIAIVVNLMFWVVGVATTFVIPLEAGGMGLTIYLWFSRVLALASDVATGATAGWLARRRGGAHGAIADAIGGLATLVGSVAIGYARMGEAGFMATTGYWLTTLSWMLFGVGVAAIAGAIAVGLRQRRG
ncbi:MAG TPA: hypothetical protein PLI00_11665 [Pseudomonadota bacterium]|nr:hypothetical protein [Xanthomonadales bacterium]HQX25410.1 hypothetical protein [Pseudomonadota bacterium]MBP6692118.1 hypothetical protein [Xanthomonadales bacterium]MBP7419256.1 hypothetical protein [Xanthomonadales bacterium]HQY37230.1 hypothetical protein [Pseudomonadota bacterium]